MLQERQARSESKPFKFSEIYIKEKEIFIRGALVKAEELQNTFSWMEAKCKYPIKCVEWEDQLALFEEHPLIDIFDKPRESESPGSEVLYFAKSKFSSPGVQIHGCEKGIETSDHRHDNRTETFKRVAGLVEARLETGGKSRIVTIQDELLVPAGTFHQLRGVGSKSLTILVTRGSGNCLDREDHTFRPGSRFT